MTLITTKPIKISLEEIKNRQEKRKRNQYAIDKEDIKIIAELRNKSRMPWKHRGKK